MTDSHTKSIGKPSQPVQVLEAPLRTSLFIAIGIAGLGVIWSATVKIPIQVEGLGVIVPAGGLSTLTAPTSGSIVYQVSTTSSAELPINVDVRNFWNLKLIKKGALRNDDLQSPDIVKFLSTIENATQPPGNLVKVSGVKKDRFGDTDILFKRGTVLAIIDSPSDREVLSTKLRQLNLNLKTRELLANKLYLLLKGFQQTYQNQISQQTLVSEQVSSQVDWAKTLAKLEKIGWVPRSLFLQASSQVLGLRSNLISSNSQLISSLQSIQDAKQKLLQLDTDTRNDLLLLRVAFFDYINKAYIIAPTDLYVANTSFRNEQFITQGSNVLLYTTSAPRLPSYINTYFNAKQASQIFPGMKTLVTPSGVSRAQYGGIVGTVTFVDTSPSSLPEITAQTGIREFGRLIDTSQSVPFRVVMSLQHVTKNARSSCRQETKNECYLWNSGEEPPFPTRLGNTVNVQATTQSETPLELVIPAFRKFFGISTDT